MSRIPLLLVTLAACGDRDEGDVHFIEYSGSAGFELDFVGGMRVGGLVLPDGTDQAVVGIMGITSEVDLDTVASSFEVDAGPGDDEVFDSMAYDGSVAVLVRTDDGIAMVDLGADAVSWQPVDATILGAALAPNGGAVARIRSASGDCSVVWMQTRFGVAYDHQVPIGPELCRGGEIEVDGDDVAWIPGAGSTARVTPDGDVQLVPVGGDRVVWSADADLVYVGAARGSEVSALASDGTVVWTAPLDRPLVNVALAPDGVLVSIGDDESSLLALDAIDGTALARIDVNDKPGRVVSRDDEIALVGAGRWDVLHRVR